MTPSPIEGFARSVVRHRVRWVVGALAVLAGALAVASRLEMRNEVRDFMPLRSGMNGADAALEAAIRTRPGQGGGGGGGADRVVVLLLADAPLEVDRAAPVLDALAARLAAARGVRRVEHRLRPELRGFLEREGWGRVLLFFDTTQLAALADRVSLPRMRQTLLAARRDTLRARILGQLGVSTAADPLGVLAPPAGMLQRAVGGARVRLADGYFTVPDRRAFIMLVDPARPLTEIEEARAFVDTVRRVAHDVGRDPALARLLAGERGRDGSAPARLLVVGKPVNVVIAYDIAVSDAQRVAAAAAIAAFVLLLLFFRHPAGPLFLMGTVCFGLAITGAIAVLLFGSASLVAWMFIAVLVGLGDEFALYITAHYWISGETGASRAAALASAMRRPGRGILFSALTSASAFLSLAVMSFPWLRELAWITALGLVAMLGSSFTVLPIALSFTAPARRERAGWRRWMAVVHALGTRWPRASLAGWVALVTVALVVAARNIDVEPHPWVTTLRSNPATAELARATELLGVSPTPLLMVSTGRSAEEALERDRAAVLELESIGPRGGVAAIESLSRWLPPMDQQRASIAFIDGHTTEFSGSRFRRDFQAALAEAPLPTPPRADYAEMVARMLDARPAPLTLGELRRLGLDTLVDRHLLRHGGEYLAVSYLYFAGALATRDAARRFDETLRLAGGEALMQARFIADAAFGASDIPRILRRDVAIATGIAVLLVGLLLWVQFRRVAPALLCLIPLACAVSVAAGVMGVLRIPLSAFTLCIGPLLVGMSVDDGIHMMDRLRRGESTLTILQESGSAMVITTLTTIAGFACLGLASVPGVRELGIVGACGILAALSASLHLLPVCYRLLESKRGRA